MTTFQILPDSELAEIRKKLIESNGNPEILGPDYMTIMRNVIYTCRMKANPMQDTPEGVAKPKKEKTESIKKEILKGDSVNDFLG